MFNIFGNKDFEVTKPPIEQSTSNSFVLTEYNYLTHNIFNNRNFTFLYYVFSQITSERAKDENSPQSKIITLLDKIGFTPYTFTEKEVLIALCNELETKEESRYGALFWENIVNFYYKSLFNDDKYSSIQDYVGNEVASRRIIDSSYEVLVPALQEVYDNDLNKLKSLIYNNPWLAALYIVAQAITVFFNTTS